MHILIIEDDAKTARAIRDGLRMDGYEATIAPTGDEGMTLCLQIRFDAIILDWMLPGQSGVEVLKSIRASGGRTPVLFLTARDALEDRVLGLDAGADDYLIKPFAFAELSARLRALIRRSHDTDAMRRRVGDLQLDLEQRRVMRGSRQIALTPREFDLLAYLSRHAGHIVTRQMLAKDVWHEIQRDTPLDNVIDVHMAHLRRKVDADHDLKLIRTIRGVGFVLGASVSE